MAGFSKVPSMRRRWFVGLSILAVVLIFAVGALLWQAAELSSLSAVSEQVSRLKPFAGAIRLLLIGMLAVFWSRLVDLATRYGRIDATDRSQLHALRWRMIIWLLIIELMIGQDLFGQFLSETSGPIA
jgi:hypothetical protein